MPIELDEDDAPPRDPRGVTRRRLLVGGGLALGLGAAVGYLALTGGDPLRPFRPSPLAPSWAVRLDGGLPDALTVAPGALYVRNASGLARYDPGAGAPRWTAPGVGPHPEGDSPPRLVGALVVVHGGERRALRALRRDTGREQWRIATPGAIAVPDDGGPLVETVWQEEGRGWSAGLEPGGRRLWVRPTPYGTDVVAAGPRTAVVLHGAGEVRAYGLDSADGRVRWSWRGPSGLASQTYEKGVLYVAHSAGLTALDPASGRELWTYRAGDGRDPHAPAVRDGLAAVAAGGRLHGIDTRTGRARWVVPLADELVSEPPAVGDGAVAVVGGDGTHRLTVHDAASGRRRWEYREDGVRLGRPVVGGGLVHVPCRFRRDANLLGLDVRGPRWD
ncbi:hypothetical protein GCM10010329_04010 [Streptomyces spiroverticillatus]|uniref:Pyrrolo-quinoline quinone repeat domain-containing protein n=1 Tax=Streptomyces finlayi TaxID=67296 RepID=A0A918WSP8_9ACTN|nr:PQQ-binding-like beta-propeller repeat protein [Streptomyces finlayi]GGZ87277.1 hypothetical protein GCM10010329_04010 [Streptomyces spiroverticillatus]GHC78545.1 hypothetical protein GCM10010334_03990 [Streptomyces finlayi]